MQPVNKNETATIKAIKDGKVLFEKDRGKPLTLSLKDNAIRHVDHAWASTTHAFQGKTVDHAVVVMPSRKAPSQRLKAFIRVHLVIALRSPLSRMMPSS